MSLVQRGPGDRFRPTIRAYGSTMATRGGTPEPPASAHCNAVAAQARSVREGGHAEPGQQCGHQLPTVVRVIAEPRSQPVLRFG